MVYRQKREVVSNLRMYHDVNIACVNINRYLFFLLTSRD